MICTNDKQRQGSELQSVECQLLSDFDLHLLGEGKHHRLYEKMGAHVQQRGEQRGVLFTVWAPNAAQVAVIGDFNNWDRSAHQLEQFGRSGVWSGFVAGVNEGSPYQFHLVSSHQGRTFDRPDPFAFRQSGPPANHSFVWNLEYQWSDKDWMANRQMRSSVAAPVAVYQVHLGSWMRVPEEGDRWLNFREAAPKLADHLKKLGFTHLELLPIMQQPVRGLQYHRIMGHFAPSAHFGTPQDLMFLIDHLHQEGIAVFLGWLPAYFPSEDPGLAFFDGTRLFERGPWPLPPAAGEGYSFDISKPEVRSFLTSNALFWLDKYHVDGIRAIAIDSLLHLDAGRKPGDWLPNEFGGRENLTGIEFLREVTSAVTRAYPDTALVADESAAWPLVSYPQAAGGLGFHYKWDPCFEEATLSYFGQDPLLRKFHHHRLIAHSEHAFSERLIAPLSERIQTQSKGSILARMAGDEWQRFANFRLLLGYAYLQPGKKLLFMGTELAQWREWDGNSSLDWHLRLVPNHDAIQRWVGDLNRVYRSETALHSTDTSAEGFEWVDRNDAEQSTFSWLRRDAQNREVILCVLNCTPVVRRNFQVGVRRAGTWREILNSDARLYGGSGQGNLGLAQTAPFSCHGLPHMLTITLPPLAMVLFKHEP